MTTIGHGPGALRDMPHHQLGRGVGFVGATFILVAAACPFLPTTWCFYLIGMVAVAGVIAGVVEYADNRVARELAQAEDTAKSKVYLQDLREADADVDAEWALLMNATTPRPLGGYQAAVDPERLRRVTRIPGQRGPGAAS